MVWPYTSRVIDGLLWPSRFDTVRMSTPLLRSTLEGGLHLSVARPVPAHLVRGDPLAKERDTGTSSILPPMPQAMRCSSVSILCMRSMSAVSASMVMVRLPLSVLGSFSRSLALVCSRQRERKAYVFRERFLTRGDKAVRAQSIRGRMALEGLYVPTQASCYSAFRSELLSFPAGKHDDQVDALGLVGQLLDQMVKGSKPAPKDSRIINTQQPTWNELFKRHCKKMRLIRETEATSDRLDKKGREPS